ncbi:thiosulfate/3-mercaptopyruvate sulfurtransferase [Pseudoalteromonas rubra]|uniref:Thiosulfate/3-mercaptopyruvate sulfurtransferase n=1 Tax=Pseudoalteromonas rubra TaxID=43658 RepID=A0A8T0CD77_9GAMM|nr:sulfurtransferase [Pseudoalteromonas rubra]KAF7788659.1 thiosulfate/3-mercaptopyruvate sulfurtransferase [Pseudoalteromonas rubra]
MKNIKSCHWLLKNLNRVTVLDCGMLKPGAKGKYVPSGIIAGAKRFDISHAFSDANGACPNTMCNAAQFQHGVRALGVNQQDIVVVYDNFALFSAARAWWMFKAMGFEQVYVLDGGLVKWLELGLPVATEYAHSSEPGDFVADPQSGYFIDKHAVLAGIDSAEVLLLDARSPARFSGQEQEPRVGMRSGHIPGSVNVHYASVLDDSGLIKPKAQLRTLLADAGVSNQALQFSCGSGVTACILAMIADECGFYPLSVYDGSWSEWGQDASLPVATCPA